jgi:ABC-type polysaccharide/polyol phosphate export permease
MTTVAHETALGASRPVTHPTNIVQQSWIMVKRNMIHTKRMPEMLSDVTVQPIMFVLLFAFVFGASIANTGGASYREFLLPGIQAQTIVFTAFVVASGITADVEKGVIDRFRSLPIRRSSVLIGRSVASLIHSSIGIVVMAITGLCIGWRIRGSLAEAVLAFALILVFGFGMIWFGILIGSVMRSVEAVNGVMFTVLWSLAMTAVLAPFALRAYARRTSD